MPFSFQILSESLSQITDAKQLQRELVAHQEEIKSLPLSAINWEDLPKGPPPTWVRTNYVCGAYALTYWCLKTEHHPFGAAVRHYAHMRDVQTRQKTAHFKFADRAAQAYPVLHEWASTLRVWLVTGRIPFEDLERLCFEAGWPPLITFDQRAWIKTKALSDAETKLQEMEIEEIAAFFAQFKDDTEAWPDWKRVQYRKDVAYNRNRPDHIRLTDEDLFKAYDRVTTAEEKIIGHLSAAYRPRGGNPSHWESFYARLVSMFARIREAQEWLEEQEELAFAAWRQDHGMKPGSVCV